MFKCFSGPIFHRIEEEVYKHDWFIKHVPVAQRPKDIMKLYAPGSCYVETDHTAFEAHIAAEFMRVSEIELYRYMIQNLPNNQEILKEFVMTLSGTNVCRFGGKRGSRRVTAHIDGTRMSGDMCTSLGNGWTNLTLMAFTVAQLGGIFDGRVEGDDGVFVVKGLQPGPYVFEKLGFRIKMQLRDSITGTSFCGNVFHPDVCDNLTDAGKQILKLGWTTSDLRFSGPGLRYELLKAKALSLQVTNPGCPILGACARWILRSLPRGTVANYRDYNVWEKEHLCGKSVDKCIDPRSRLLYQQEFNTPVATQLQIENWFNSQTHIRPIPFCVVAPLCKPEWVAAYADTFSIPADILDSRRRRMWFE